ncbi:MAG: CTP synthase [Candidatus Vogelbacteria bacterium]|nr:CTP synthase [Candidatus Vogelbacteria bacterium]
MATKKKTPKYIFVVGGVMSGVGKGTATASLGLLLKRRGFNVTAIKADPYINVDAGTMNPIEHGEVFVTDDGDETDQDIGSYERFLDTTILSHNYMTTGRVYRTVIEKERALEYGGKCVEVVPHIPEEIIRRFKEAQKKADADFVMVEIGGTIGEYQNILFLEAARMMKQQAPEDVLFVLVSYLPIPGRLGEMKTKPTQYAARTLNSAGIQADFIVARASLPIDEPRKKKIGMFCSVPEECVISGPDMSSVYRIPIMFEEQKFADLVLKKLGLKAGTKTTKEWFDWADEVREYKHEVRIGVVGKYFTTGSFMLADAYFSVVEALRHAVWANKKKPILEWIDSEKFEKDPKSIKELKKYDGIVVPGGFGKRGIEGIIYVIKYARENKIPYLGLCYGMQLAVVEYTRHVLGLKDAHTTEIDKKTSNPVIDIMPEQFANLQKSNFGGSMRLGAYLAVLREGTIAIESYAKSKNSRWNFEKKNGGAIVHERHRHRYEVNPEYIMRLENSGMIFSGKSPNGVLMEIMELPKKTHPFFLGTQFHPEYTSGPLKPHPLFTAFIKAATADRK